MHNIFRTQELNLLQVIFLPKSFSISLLGRYILAKVGELSDALFYLSQYAVKYCLAHYYIAQKSFRLNTLFLQYWFKFSFVVTTTIDIINILFFKAACTQSMLMDFQKHNTHQCAYILLGNGNVVHFYWAVVMLFVFVGPWWWFSFLLDCVNVVQFC